MSPRGKVKPPVFPRGEVKPPVSPRGKVKPPVSPRGKVKPPVSPKNIKPPLFPPPGESSDRPPPLNHIDPLPQKPWDSQCPPKRPPSGKSQETLIVKSSCQESLHTVHSFSSMSSFSYRMSLEKISLCLAFSSLFLSVPKGGDGGE